MTKQLIYAGIGSRETPADVLSMMEKIGYQLAQSGWHLRSGYADGADQGFGRGAEGKGPFTMYLPWEGFNNAPLNDPRFLVPTWTYDIVQVAKKHHPNWNRLKDPVKLLMARNVCQVLGEDLATPASCVICWTPGGKAGGGTGMAIRIARTYDIPVFDLAIESARHALVLFVAQAESENGMAA